jgi:hypothetical protein
VARPRLASHAANDKRIRMEIEFKELVLMTKIVNIRIMVRVILSNARRVIRR